MRVKGKRSIQKERQTSDRVDVGFSKKTLKEIVSLLETANRVYTVKHAVEGTAPHCHPQ